MLIPPTNNVDREPGFPALFLGIGKGGIFHYRQLLPALAVGADVATWDADAKGFVEMAKPVHDNPEVCVFQMPVADDHLRIMLAMRKRGMKIVANVDDYIMNIRKQSDHHFTAHHFTKRVVESHQRILTLSDAVIVSTQWLADKLSRFNDNVFVCRNGLDLPRYEVHDTVDKAQDDKVIVGWAGGTGHKKAMQSISGELKTALWENPQMLLVFVGEDFSYLFTELDASVRNRIAILPWSESLYDYPRALAGMDVALAPSDTSHFYAGKSQLRLYESGALNVPVIGGPRYTEIQHGVTGFRAVESGDWVKYIGELVQNDSLRKSMGQSLGDYVREYCSIEARASDWLSALESIRSL